jgi:hypothetical protein
MACGTVFPTTNGGTSTGKPGGATAPLQACGVCEDFGTPSGSFNVNYQNVIFFDMTNSQTQWSTLVIIQKLC